MDELAITNKTVGGSGSARSYNGKAVEQNGENGGWWGSAFKSIASDGAKSTAKNLELDSSPEKTLCSYRNNMSNKMLKISVATSMSP